MTCVFMRKSNGMLTVFAVASKLLRFGISLSISLENLGAWSDEEGRSYFAAVHYLKSNGWHEITMSLWALAVAILFVPKGGKPCQSARK